MMWRHMFRGLMMYFGLCLVAFGLIMVQVPVMANLACMAIGLLLMWTAYRLA